ncbi:aldehyde dehydrogenase (NADP(+)) [Massilia sp. TS11]|uniref:aldehyde dehydrogenase (NADP(+)) n=1 Tax=Massilia sp. TS11 TaxID=2908003 RepID=UPI001EDA2138|nr:aldehyde dehydrogenase (NADP(+)) [Massilia sp. TS11]MCG2583773.1 aldehyde dehydrogenase (NADP(+)) [Massilia sp. TS11]
MITGHMFIGQRALQGDAGSIRATNPATGEKLEPAFGLANESVVAEACALAAAAFDSYRETAPEARARFLETIADNIMALGSELIERAMLETGLPQARLEGERGRTCNQLRMFAQVVRDGHYLSATLDSALPNRVPPRPDLRLRRVAIGPVAVFGASNFPLAFSVAGGDTASALAAGCPVIVKAHSAHPGTSELVGRAVQKAVADCALPEGTFSMLFGGGNLIGQALVGHPAIKAVGFTGSRNGGVALMKTAAARKEPIPVYAEMSSINPVFLLPGAISGDVGAFAQAYVDSLTLGAGQFCTNPGLVLALAGPALDAFLQAAGASLNTRAAATMLSPGIHSAYNEGVAAYASVPGVQCVARGQSGSQACPAQAALFVTDVATYQANHALEAEVFGPAALVVKCKDEAEMLAFAEQLEGQLTATVHALPEDYALAARLVPILERKAGRILFNGFPTGVEVCHAMVHGGPYPSTSDGRSTSVGAQAIERFLRSVCYQNFPGSLLPAAIADGNPLKLVRLQDGKLQAAD